MIPKKICQTWKTKNLPKKIEEIIHNFRKTNFDYEYQLFDDNDCKKIILEHFGINFLHAFEALKHGAFKADFFRYCYLYIYGGVYIDIDMVPLVPLSEIISEKDVFVSVVDRTCVNSVGIYQSFIATVPRHPILKYSLELAFYNIASRRNDIFNPLVITGPVVMGIALNLYWNRKDTNEKIIPGIYDDVKLYKNKGDVTVNLEGKTIFKNKLEEYKTKSYGYGSVYKNDPRGKFFTKVLTVIGICIIIILVIFLIRLGIYKKDLHRCKTSSESIGY